MSFIRSFKLKHEMNADKQNQLIQVIFNYRRTAHLISKNQWLHFFKNKEKFDKNRDIKHIQSNLSQRYKQTCQYQVVGQLNSFLSNTQQRFVDTVNNSSIKEEIKIKLFYINKYKKWFHNSVVMQKKEIEPHIIFLARKIFKHLTKNKPSFNRFNLVLDEKVVVVNKKQDGLAKKYDYWVSISTLKKGHPIFIPVLSNKYFEDKSGIFKKAIQLNYKNNEISISFIKEMNAETIDYIKESLGVDIGTVNFIANDKGELLGKSMIKHVNKMDDIIVKLGSELKKQGIKPNDNERYKKLNNRLREYLKNEIGRIINKMVKRHKPKEIVVEKLDFRGSNIGRKNNRRLHRFGKGILTNKLKNICEEKDILLKEINPAYTSRECNVCHNIEKGNRSDRNEFKCTCCGYKINADIGASRNILYRSSIEFNKLNKEKIFQLLVKKHDNWKEKCCYRSAKNAKKIFDESWVSFECSKEGVNIC